MSKSLGDVEGAIETQDRQIAAALIDDIVDWRIPPGSWIREREVAERFGVSHAPVREAFRHVANFGFVKIVPWRGAHVIDIEPHAVREVFELWKALFGVVCRLAATKLTDEKGKELLQRLDAYDRLVRMSENTFEHLTASNRIGAFIARHSDAPLATEMLDRIALFARWQHHASAEEYLVKETEAAAAGSENDVKRIIVEAAIRSAELYRELAHAIIRRDVEEADRRARALLQHLQERTVDAFGDFLARRNMPAAKPSKRTS